MAGIRALSPTVKMTVGETVATGLTKAGFARSEQVLLAVTPVFSAYLWTLARPAGSSAARAYLSSSTAASPVFTPDVNGEFILTCTDGTTFYDLTISVTVVAPAEIAHHVRMPAVRRDEVPVTPGGRTVCVDAQTGEMSAMDDQRVFVSLESGGGDAPVAGAITGDDGTTITGD
jgi:hypothetical protein